MAVQAQADKQSTFADTLRTAWKQAARIIFNPFVGALIFLVFGAGVFFGGFAHTFGNITWDGVIEQGFSNLGIELVSIALTVIVVDQLNRRRDERERKEELILQMGSPVNDAALEAVRQLRNKGWLFDGSLDRLVLVGANLKNVNLGLANLSSVDLRGANLQGAYLEAIHLQNANLAYANLQSANLIHANLHLANLQSVELQEADLTHADLQEADLTRADLQKAELQRANLQETNLRGSYLNDANLSHADLRSTNLQDVDFFCTNLRGANLSFANLQGALLYHQMIGTTEFDRTTILPDESHWLPGRDMREFTDPDGWAAGKYKEITSPGADAPPSP